MKNNKKGFTLVELLAVIVILAVVILIAVTAVIPRMNKAKERAFEDEALAFIKAAEEKSVAENAGDGLCYTIAVLKDGNSTTGEKPYVQKSDGTTYAGVVKRTSTTADWTIYIRQTNKDNFYINGKTASQVSSSSGIGTSSSAPSGFVTSCS